MIDISNETSNNRQDKIRKQYAKSNDPHTLNKIRRRSINYHHLATSTADGCYLKNKTDIKVLIKSFLYCSQVKAEAWIKLSERILTIGIDSFSNQISQCRSFGGIFVQ